MRASVIDFNAERDLVQKQQRAERLILCGGTDVSLDREPGQERRDFSGAHLGWVRLSVEHDVSANPVDVRLLGPRAVMTQTDRVSDAIQEFWRAAARVIWKGLDETNGQQFLVLELVDGETLDKRIALGPIPIAEALSIATQVAEPLEAAHEKADSELDSSAEELKGLVPTK